MQYRNTKQKSIIFSVIDHQGHVSATELAMYLKQQDISIPLATIYRNLTVLTNEGKIKKIHNQNKVIYETLKEQHYHFECEKCHQVIDIAPEMVNIKFNHSIAKITKKELFLYGICNDCKNNNE